MPRITPCLWYDATAGEAIDCYVACFRDGQVLWRNDDPSGTLTLAGFRLANLDLMALAGNSHAPFTPAVSFFVGCETGEELDALWAALSEGGMTLMELQEYPFSPKFGWVQDRFGISWQLSLTGTPQTVTPFLMYVGDQCGRAEEAINRYVGVIPDSHPGNVERHDGKVMVANFTLAGLDVMASDSDAPHQFTFSEATSFMISCETQAEIDHHWNGLLEGGGTPGQCGWLKDAYGVSWQVVPQVLGELLQDPDPDRAKRVMQAMLRMGKIDIAGLQAAAQA
jgi:predicted 3-demethylubiquinone-9 3-methyltransferase (glyoxalase superfamily)